MRPALRAVWVMRLNKMRIRLDSLCYGLHQSWTHWTEGFTALLGCDDLRIETMEAMDTRRRRGAAFHQASAGAWHQLFRYRRHVFGGQKRGSPRPCLERLRSRPRPRHYCDESLYADERRSQ